MQDFVGNYFSETISCPDVQDFCRRICPGGTVEFVQDFFVILSRNSVGREVTSWTINCRLSRIFCDFVQDFCDKSWQTRYF